MKHLVALLLCAPAAAQESAPAPDSGEQWKKYDWVEVQAGDDVITYSDVIRHTRVAIERHMVSVTTRADMERLMHKTLEDLVLMALEAQAGEDRELSPVDIEDRIDRFLSDRRRDTGVVDYVEQLEASGVSPLRERELQKSGYYTSSFRNQGLHGPRPTRDAYLRPGELRELYRTEGARLGGKSSYRFQDLVVTAEQVGGVEEARSLAERLRQELVDGADFATLHEEYGTTELATGGVTKLFGAENPMPDPTVRRFGEEGQVGAISDVLAIHDPRNPDEIVAFRVLRIYERTPGTPPPAFPDAQAEIRKLESDSRADVWLWAARSRLNQSSYLWSPDRTEPDSAPTPAAEPAAEPAPAPQVAPR